MDVDVVSLLRELDFSIEEGTSARSWLLRSPDNAIYLVTMVPSVQRVTARTIRNFIVQGSPVRPLFVGRTATDGVLKQARAGAVDMLTEQPLQLILIGAVFAPEVEHPAPVHRKITSGKRAWGRWAIERCLLQTDTPMRQWQIANQVGVSQQMVSRVCRQLEQWITATPDGVVLTESTKLLERWREEYPGAGGQQFGWYSLDPPLNKP